jgi:hypothetical protein
MLLEVRRASIYIAGIGHSPDPSNACTTANDIDRTRECQHFQPAQGTSCSFLSWSGCQNERPTSAHQLEITALPFDDRSHIAPLWNSSNRTVRKIFAGSADIEIAYQDAHDSESRFPKDFSIETRMKRRSRARWQETHSSPLG